MGEATESHTLVSHTRDYNPLIVVHRLPSYDNFFKKHLISNYTLIDPVVLADPDPTSHLSYLRRHGGCVRALLCVDSTPLGKDVLDCLPSLECIVASITGTEHIDLSECRRRGISVTNVGEAFSDDVADYAVALLFNVLRKVPVGVEFVRAGMWLQGREFHLGHSLGRKRVGIVGLGRIGHRVAKRMLAFGCSIAYTSRRKKSGVPHLYFDNVLDLALESDILILCCSLTDETRHLVDKDVLTALGKEGVVINVGRGALIDETELVQFLVEGRIAGAGLDVFEDEPNVPKELFGLENVVLSHHQADCTDESFKAVIDIVVANLDAFFSNKPLLTPVNTV